MRDYRSLLDAAAKAGPLDRDAAMRLAVSLLWNAFGHKPISWVGFYLKPDDQDEMILVCREPKPACSPLGLHGMCGRCWKARKPILLADARKLPSDGYIACDPKDLSEVVVPMIERDQRTCPGVLDVDSYEAEAFDENDARGMHQLLVTLGLTHAAWCEPLRL